MDDDNSTTIDYEDSPAITTESVLSESIGEGSVSYALGDDDDDDDDDDDEDEDIFTLDKESLEMAKCYAEDIEDDDCAIFKSDDLDEFVISSLHSTECESLVTDDTIRI